MLQKEIRAYIEEHYEETLVLLRTLCRIPAPSHQEQERAAFCKEWLELHGAQGVYMDSALNVIYPYHCEGSNEITVLAAHTDTVFPDTTPMPYREDEEKIYCPGVGDDTASLAVLLMTVKFFIQKKIIPAKGILFVCNSCEEGLGNLEGTKKLMKDFSGRITRFIAMDSDLHVMNTKCVGSHRYRVEVKTEGGHSFQDFGKPNAIVKLSEIISRIYAIDLPKVGNSRTSYNVGTIEGGTSVNTIAQSAQMLCEYRSDHVDCLRAMQMKFQQIFEGAAGDGVEVSAEMIGERPCAVDVDSAKAIPLYVACRKVIEDVTKTPVAQVSASTDCNIPLSMGIPAVCIGVYIGGGSHTREEWVEKASLRQGLEIAIRILYQITKEGQ